MGQAPRDTGTAVVGEETGHELSSTSMRETASDQPGRIRRMRKRGALDEISKGREQLYHNLTGDKNGSGRTGEVEGAGEESQGGGDDIQLGDISRRREGQVHERTDGMGLEILLAGRRERGDPVGG